VLEEDKTEHIRLAGGCYIGRLNFLSWPNLRPVGCCTAVRVHIDLAGRCKRRVQEHTDMQIQQHLD
jgi:hypothetical protein